MSPGRNGKELMKNMERTADTLSPGVEEWLRRVRVLLADVQWVLEESPGPTDLVPREVATRLAARLRECRAGVPDREKIGAWVRLVVGDPSDIATCGRG